LFFNNLITGNTEIWTYAYDPFGRRLSKERQDKLAWTSTEPKRTHFVWDGSRLLQEYTYKGCYTYIYTDQDSYEPLAQVFHNNQDETQYLAYFHTDQIGIPKEMTDIHGNLLWYGEYTAWGRLKKDERVYKDAHQPFRLQNQYYDEETGLHYNLMRYYEPEVGRFVNQDPIGLWGGDNLYSFGYNTQNWIDVWGLNASHDSGKRGIAKAEKWLAKNGFTPLGDEVSVYVTGKTKNGKLVQVRIRPDKVAKGPNGMLYLIEVKNNTGSLTRNQSLSKVFDLSRPFNDGEGKNPDGRECRKLFRIATNNKKKRKQVQLPAIPRKRRNKPRKSVVNIGVANFILLKFDD